MQGLPNNIHFRTFKYNKHKNHLEILDQTCLPGKEQYVILTSIDSVYTAIQTMQVRGAPLIGVTAAYGLAMHAKEHTLDEVVRAADHLVTARPTAVNLKWAVDRVRSRMVDVRSIYDVVLDEAQRIEKEDKHACENIGTHGASLITDNAVIMVHCNAGALATSGIGTALGILYTAVAQEKHIMVYACETRPLFQGARLTAWELTRNGINTTVICDNMAASFLPDCSAVIVGADRIARNGDTANKIGTCSLAILTRYFKIPLYVAAPLSSFDCRCLSGSTIPIEQRDGEEIRMLGRVQTVPTTANVKNPAFDITPAELITAIITEHGIIQAPFTESIEELHTNIT